jgi:hypothetical protein
MPLRPSGLDGVARDHHEFAVAARYRGQERKEDKGGVVC